MEKIQNIQKKIGKMKKDTEGYNYKYFDINQLLEKLTPLLHEEGLTLIQPLTHIEGKPAIATIISDTKNPVSGVNNNIINYVMPLPEITKPQDMGSAITYYRRYSLQSLFALEAEDDDGIIKSSKKETTKEYQARMKALKDNGGDPLDDL